MAELDPRRWKALAIVCAAFFMTVLDVSIVNVALPSIGRALDFSRENLQWVITAYAITFGGFLLLGGRAADLLRPAPRLPDGCRGLHDRVVPLRLRVVRRRPDRRARGAGPRRRDHLARRALDHHDDVRGGPERNKALGIWGAIGGSGAAVGVLAGGVLTKYLGWEWIFFVNVPVGIAAFLLAPRFVRESRSDRESSPDIAGAVTVTVRARALRLRRLEGSGPRLDLRLDVLAHRRLARAARHLSS